MSARDLFHDAFVKALQKDGWQITHDPLRVTIGKRDLLIDLGAERLLAAEREGERIAVEIKSFLGASVVQDLKEALGQFIIYGDVLLRSPTDSDRTLFLAIREEAFEELFEEPIGKMLIENRRLRLVVFDSDSEVITRWIS